MTKHQLIMIHGMGEGDSEKDYDKLQRHISDKLNNPERFEFVHVEWQAVTHPAEKKIFEACFSEYAPAPESLVLSQIPLHPIRSVRYFMTFYVGDIVAYTADKENKNGIRKQVWSQIKKPCKESPYSLLCHSLGSVIAFDYLYKLFIKKTFLFPGDVKENDASKLAPFKDNFKHFFTFGSPIGLFLMRQGKLWSDEENLFTGIKNPVEVGHEWLNFYDKQDGVAYPLKPLFTMSDIDKTAKIRITDVQVDTGDLVVDSHTKYWGNEDVAQGIANVLNAKP